VAKRISIRNVKKFAQREASRFLSFIRHYEVSKLKVMDGYDMSSQRELSKLLKNILNRKLGSKKFFSMPIEE